MKTNFQTLQFLDNVEPRSRVSSLHVDFSSSTMGYRLFRTSIDHKVARIFNANNCAAGSAGSQYIRYIVDKYSGFNENAAVTSVLTLFMNIIDFIFPQRMIPDWTPRNLCQMHCLINKM